jgi:molybdate transport system ATP-binding protein
VSGGLDIALAQEAPMRLHGGLRCAPGQLVALVGPSGAGKSSLLRAVAGLMRPEQGRIALGDAVWSDSSTGVFVPPQHRRVGMVFQDYALMPHLSALHNVALPLRDADRLTQARQMLQRVGLSEEQMQRRPSALSGGQQQRVAVARALVRQPSVLLLDEPFSAVDQMTRQSLYALLADLRADIAVPMLLVTHDLHEARLLADELVVMADGEVLQQGSAQAIHNAPRNARVADVVGIANRFTGVWRGPDANSPDGQGWLEWTHQGASHRLCVTDKGRIDPGQMVNWVLPGAGLRLLPNAQGTTTSTDCTAVLAVDATVQSVRHLGDVWLVKLRDNSLQALFQLQLTGAEWQQLQVGQRVVLQMDRRAIHIMPTRPAQALWPHPQR